MTTDKHSSVVRDVLPHDHLPIWQINQANLPAVSSVTQAELGTLLGMCNLARVAEVDGAVAGFLMCLIAGQAYHSVNYRWFTARYPQFLYVDRIALGASAQRRGIGSQLYREAKAHAAAMGVTLLCEVNIKPRNDVSLAFHEAMGFVSVGEQDTEPGKRVVMLAYNVASS